MLRMTNTLKIAAIQVDLAWQKPLKNRVYFERLLPNLATQNVDLVVLPEMFSTGFTMQTEEFAEEMNGTTVQWLQNCAKSYNFLLTGSLIIKEKGQFFNRQIFAFPNEELQYYDKRHLFRMGGEDKHYTAGAKRVIVTYKGWRICPQICYDLRFPVWSRNCDDYDLLLYVANFPTARRKVWNTLLAARSIENQCYVVGCNRIGNDGNGLAHSGDTQILSPKGEILAAAEENMPSTMIFTLNKEDLYAFREKFPVHLDADDFIIHE